VAAVLILLAKSFIQPARGVRRLHQQHARKAVALFADRAQVLFTARASRALSRIRMLAPLPLPIRKPFQPSRNFRARCRMAGPAIYR
jgi:hypothetical protein